MRPLFLFSPQATTSSRLHPDHLLVSILSALQVNEATGQPTPSVVKIPLPPIGLASLGIGREPVCVCICVCDCWACMCVCEYGEEAIVKDCNVTWINSRHSSLFPSSIPPPIPPPSLSTTPIVMQYMSLITTANQWGLSTKVLPA